MVAFRPGVRQHMRTIQPSLRPMAGALLALLFCCPAQAAGGNAEPDPAEDFKLRQVRTEHMRLIYLHRDQEYLIPHLTRCFENSLNYHRRLFDYTPDEYVTLIFQDMDDHGYAGTTTMPYNYLTLGIEPFEHVYETSPTNERINWVMSHELLHIVASDKPAPSDARCWRSSSPRPACCPSRAARSAWRAAGSRSAAAPRDPGRRSSRRAGGGCCRCRPRPPRHRRRRSDRDRLE